MSKLLTVAILCISFCAIGLIFSLNSFINDYTSFHNPQKSSASNGQLLETTHFEKLQKLAQYPLVGRFYTEALVNQMVMKKDFPQVLEIATTAVQSITHRRSYKMWYYKAVAECGTIQLSQCRKSLYQAELLAPLSFNEHISNLFKVFNFKHESNLKTMRQQLCEI